MFSKACEYAIRAMLYIAVCQKTGQRAGVHDIAVSVGSPEAFTGKILQQLTRAGLLRSVKGPGGGFALGRSEAQICLADIVRAIDGEGLFVNCALGLQVCSSEQPCPLHFQFKPIRDQLRETLSNATIQDIGQDISLGHSILKTSIY